LLLLTSSLAAPQVANAAYDPVGSGVVKLTFSSEFRSLLARHQVKIKTSGGAEMLGAKAVLPAGEGEVDPRAGTGTIEGSGAVVFVAGPRTVKLRKITFEAKHTPLLAKVGGGQLKLVTARKLISRRSGFGASFAAVDLRLTAKVAQRLNKKLRLGDALSPGQPVGKLTVSAQPVTVHLLPKGRVRLALDPAFYEKLNNRFVAVNPIAPAELGAGPILSFPVGPESIFAPDGTSGLVKLGGSVELLQLGSAQYFWRQLQLEPAVATLGAETDLEPSPPQAGRSEEAPLLTVEPGEIASNPRSRTIEAAGQAATLSATTAAAMNAAFAEGKPLFAPGELVGTLSATFTGE
jgi:hypothetical protein